VIMGDLVVFALIFGMVVYAFWEELFTN